MLYHAMTNDLESKFTAEEALKNIRRMHRVNSDVWTLKKEQPATLKKDESSCLKKWKKKIVSEPRPRLTTCLRIFLIVAALGGVVAFVWDAHRYRVYEQRQAPTLFFSIEFRKPLRWNDFDVVCDKRRTPGAECTEMLEKYAGYVAYHVEDERTANKHDINMFSSVSSIILSLPQSYTRALTLATFSGAATLNVHFEFQNNTLWWARHNWIPLMKAASVAHILVDAGIKPFIHITDPVNGCKSLYLGGTTRQENFGLPSKCFSPDCDFNNFTSESKSEVCFEDDCTNHALQQLGLGSGFGFEEFHCNAWKSPYFESTLHYFVFSLVIAAIATALTIWLVSSRLHAFLLHEATHQLLHTWPALQRIAAEETRPLKSVIIQRCSLFMCAECSAVGDSRQLARCFNYLPEGCHGAVVHIIMVVASVVPLHIFHMMLEGNEQPEELLLVLKCYLTLHYVVHLSFAICYYLRSLPLQFSRGMFIRMYRYMTSLSLCLSCIVMYTVLLWTLSAIYFAQSYVLGIFVLFGSCAAFVHNATSVLDNHVRAVQKKLNQHIATDLHHVGEAAGKIASSAMKSKTAAQRLVKRNVQNTGEFLQQAASGTGIGIGLSKANPKVPRAMADEVVDTDQQLQSITHSSNHSIDAHDLESSDFADDTQHHSIQPVRTSQSRVGSPRSYPGLVGGGAREPDEGIPTELDEATTSIVAAPKEQADNIKQEDARAVNEARDISAKLESGEVEVGVLHKDGDEVANDLSKMHKDGDEVANDLSKMGIVGRELYVTFAIAALLLILTTIFTIMGASQWRGNKLGGFSPTHLLAPVVVVVNRLRSQSILDKH